MFRQAASKVALMAVSVGISLLVCEFVLSTLSPTQYYVWRPGRSFVTNPRTDIMPGISGRKRFTINEWGIRGDTFSEDQRYRILAIGGSTTECFYLDDSEAWPYLLQERLNAGTARKVWVGNVGKSGLNSRDHLLTARLLLDQYPKIDAIVLLVGINDFLRTLALDDGYRPSPSLDSLSREQYDGLVRRIFEVHPVYHRTHLPLYERTHVWERVRKIKRYFREAPYEQEDDGGQYVRFRAYRQAARIRSRLPDLSASLHEYASNLDAIAALAKERGARPIFLTQPTMWRADLEPELRKLVWMGGLGDYMRRGASDYYAVEALAEGVARYNDVLRRVCRENDVELIDLDVLQPIDLSLLYDDCHFNESGSRRLTAVVVDYLLREGRWERLSARSARLADETARDARVAGVTVYHDALHPSALTLPVVSRD